MARRQAPRSTVTDVEFTNLGCVDWPNERRPHLALGDVTSILDFIASSGGVRADSGTCCRLRVTDR